MSFLFNMDSEITWQHSRSPGRWFSWQKHRSPERKAGDKLQFHHFTRLLTFKYSWKQCNKAAQQDTSVVSEGGVRVPKRGVVKFSQNLSLWLTKKKRGNKTPYSMLIMWFFTFTCFSNSKWDWEHLLTLYVRQRWHYPCDPARGPGGRPGLLGGAAGGTSTCPAVWSRSGPTRHEDSSTRPAGTPTSLKQGCL